MKNATVVSNHMDRSAMSNLDRILWDFLISVIPADGPDPAYGLYSTSRSCKPNRRIKPKALAYTDPNGPYLVMDECGRIWYVPSIAYQVHEKHRATFDTPMVLFHGDDGGVIGAYYAWPMDRKRLDFSEATYYAQYYNVPLNDERIRFGVYPKSLPDGLRTQMSRGILTTRDVNRLMFDRLGLKLVGS